MLEFNDRNELFQFFQGFRFNGASQIVREDNLTRLGIFISSNLTVRQETSLFQF